MIKKKFLKQTVIIHLMAKDLTQQFVWHIFYDDIMNWCNIIDMI